MSLCFPSSGPIYAQSKMDVRDDGGEDGGAVEIHRTTSVQHISYQVDGVMPNLPAPRKRQRCSYNTEGTGLSQKGKKRGGTLSSRPLPAALPPQRSRSYSSIPLAFSSRPPGNKPPAATDIPAAAVNSTTSSSYAKIGMQNPPSATKLSAAGPDGKSGGYAKIGLDNLSPAGNKPSAASDGKSGSGYAKVGHDNFVPIAKPRPVPRRSLSMQKIRSPASLTSEPDSPPVASENQPAVSRMPPATPDSKSSSGYAKIGLENVSATDKPRPAPRRSLSMQRSVSLASPSTEPASPPPLLSLKPLPPTPPPVPARRGSNDREDVPLSVSSASINSPFAAVSPAGMTLMANGPSLLNSSNSPLNVHSRSASHDSTHSYLLQGSGASRSPDHASYKSADAKENASPSEQEGSDDPDLQEARALLDPYAKVDPVKKRASRSLRLCLDIIASMGEDVAAATGDAEWHEPTNENADEIIMMSSLEYHPTDEDTDEVNVTSSPDHLSANEDTAEVIFMSALEV